jgi:hypothetical protein
LNQRLLECKFIRHCVILPQRARKTTQMHADRGMSQGSNSTFGGMALRQKISAATGGTL